MMGLIVAVAVLSVVCAGLVGSQMVLWRRHKAMVRRVEAGEVVLKAARRQFDSTSKNIDELRDGFLGLGNELHQLVDKQEQFSIKLNEVTYIDPEHRLYSRANKLAEMGASLDELMQECELPKAEAELMLNLQRQMKQRRPENSL